MSTKLVSDVNRVRSSEGRLVATVWPRRVEEDKRIGEPWIDMHARLRPAREAANAESLELARLFAAAPDLLAVLRDARMSVEANRGALFEAHYQPHTGDVDAAGRVAVDDEDKLLARIDAAIFSATGGAA